MKEDGILYLVNSLENLFGIPVRVYKQNELLRNYSNKDLVKDPFILYDSFLNDHNDKHVSYITTPNSYYFVKLTSNEYQIVVGPFSYFTMSLQVILDLAFTLDVKQADKNRFVSAMSSISTMPLSTVIQSLCSYNYILNNEKLSLGDVTILEDIQQEHMKSSLENEFAGNDITQTRNSTWEIEETLSKFVVDGNMDGFVAWCKSAPSIRAGAMSNDALRQHKDTFIVSATLFSRAAIKGGLTYNVALDMSDQYIRQVELCKNYDEVNNLSYSMVKAFIYKVSQVKNNDSPLSSKVANYVYSHISEKISLDDLCKYLYISKANLCLRFKKETGKTVNEFILDKRLMEGKRLLLHTNKSISSIALYLGFSSQSHFNKVFKQYIGISPLKYRHSL